MATASEARVWARGALRGIGDSLYTPFCGTDGDDIDGRPIGRWCATASVTSAPDVVVHQRHR